MAARPSQQILRAAVRASGAPRASVVRSYSVLARSRLVPCASPVKVNYNLEFVHGGHELKYARPFVLALLQRSRLAVSRLWTLLELRKLSTSVLTGLCQSCKNISKTIPLRSSATARKAMARALMRATTG